MGIEDTGQVGTSADGVSLDVLAGITLRAGRAIMGVYRRGDPSAAIEAAAKADASPVTEADLAADALIAEGLAEAYPAIAAVTEEQVASQGIRPEGAFFLVDPLDGTKEFVQRRGDFTVNIGLIEGGTPVAGVVFAPARGRLYAGRVGQGAWIAETDDGCAEIRGTRRPITVRRPDPAALAVVASKSHMNAETAAVIGAFEVAETRNAGSSLKFCLVAEGAADFYPRLGRTMEWDTAAGHAVLSAAGGAVSLVDGRTPLAYGKPGWDNPYFLAHAPGVPVERAAPAYEAVAGASA